MNETRSGVPIKAFTNFFSLNSTSNRFSKGVAILFRYIVAYIEINKLEADNFETDKDKNTFIVGTKISSLKKPNTTAYVKPEEKREFIQINKGLEVCKSYAEENNMKSFVFFGVALLGTTTGATKYARHFEMNHQV